MKNFRKVLSKQGVSQIALSGKNNPMCVRRSQASIEKARVINYKPEYGLEEGLKWYRESLLRK